MVCRCIQDTLVFRRVRIQQYLIFSIVFYQPLFDICPSFWPLRRLSFCAFRNNLYQVR